MPFKKYLLSGLLLASLVATSATAAENSDRSTPYDLIRPVWPLTWDTTVFDLYDTTVTVKHNMVPKKRTPASFAPNEFIPDTLNQAYLDAMNVRMSPIRVNQAGYMENDPERQFYYVGTASTFEIVNADGSSFSPAITGAFSPTGTEISSDWTIIAGTNAATNDQKRYQVDITGQSGIVQRGNIPLNVPTETRLRIKVGNDISSTFIVSNKVYSMVRNASLKFYGINRSGNGESWFHKASHTKDGAGPVVTGAEDVRDFNQYNASLEGTLEGGYYDCGDHLKESQTQMYAFMVAAVMAAANPNADQDVYAYNQNETANTDGIPDMLREAKHGADFVLRAYRRAKGVIDDMALSVGNFGSDHGWWGRPENQDLLPINGTAAATDRGGPVSRTVRLGEIGANIGGETAAGLAILSKDYREFDPDFADSCLMVAEKMYDFAKALATGKSTYDGGKPFVNNKEAAGWSSPAYNGNNEYFDDMALASVALWYATGKKEYADDAIRSRTLGTTVPQSFMENCVGCFEGGWFVTDNKGFLKNNKNTSWANAYAYATYALYKLILADKNKALTEYGLTEKEWQDAIEDCVMSMIHNLSDVSAGSATITLPSKDPANYMVQGIGWKGNSVSYDPLWYSMQTDQTWIYNRYQAGNIFEVLAYADVAKDIQDKGIVLPNLGSPDWKADEMHQLGINQLNYLLGVNPWDVSYILGIGDKNDNHPHHRAANPEGKNQPGAGYKYNPPVGALYGGVTPGLTNSMVPDNKSWEDYHKSETCIDAAATLVATGALAADKYDRTAAPNVSVEIRHVSKDSAIVMVKFSTRGSATIFYGTDEANMTQTATDAQVGVQHEIVLGKEGTEKLMNGTTYYFYVVGQNAYVPENATVKYMVDSTQTPYSFTTLNTVENAQIANITVCNLTGDSAEIMWYTPNGEYESKLYWDTEPHGDVSEYRFNSGTGNADIAGLPTKFHYVKIGGLSEKTTYYYAVESNGIWQNVDAKGDYLTFTTPVGWYDFSVRTYQYEFGGMDFLDANVYNNEARPFDSLTLRLYFTATPDQVEKCATLIDSDICQAYDEAGFNKPCENDRELRDLLRAALPIRLEDTYNADNGTYSYYFPAPLGSSMIKSQSRLRIDFGFSSGISNDNFITCETMRQPGKKRFSKETGDWSWAPHEFLKDGADYDGMPIEDKDYGDTDNEVPENKFIAVYRKDEFIWGYSPSKTEMKTKRAHYKIETTLDAPFNVSNGSYVQIDQTSSIMYVTGHASISEQGYITKIWANGQQIKAMTNRIGDEIFMVDENHEIIAHYNITRGDGPIDSTGLWTLNIPVKMAIGSNKVDITIFAGPDPECEECTENGGCAFENRSYYVQFTRGNLTASALTIKDELGNPVSSPADPAGTRFFIYLTDKDKKNYNRDLIVNVINNRKDHSLKIKMVEDPENPGSFKSASAITAIATAKNLLGGNQISFYPGDTIQVVYEDPDDPEDVSRQTFFAESKEPEPKKILAQDTDCDDIADRLYVEFTNPLTEQYHLDSIRVFLPGMTDSTTLTVKVVSVPDPVNPNILRDSIKVYMPDMSDSASAEAIIDSSYIYVPLPNALGITKTAAPKGASTVYLTADGATTKTTTIIGDGILPRLESVTLLENPDHADPYDTLMISFTEPVSFKDSLVWPLFVDNKMDPNIKVLSVTTEDQRSWRYAISGNTPDAAGISTIMEGKTVRAVDKKFHDVNSYLDPAKACEVIKIVETPRPVPITIAEMRDPTGHGAPTELYMVFEKVLRPKDMLDSFEVEWGNPSILKSFKKGEYETHVETKQFSKMIAVVDPVTGEPVLNVDGSPVLDSILVTDSVTVATVAIQDGVYPLGTTTGSFNEQGAGKVLPRLGPIGGFFNKSYTVDDRCPPIITRAVWSTHKDYDMVTLTLSEPVNKNKAGTYYVMRSRERDVSVIAKGDLTFTDGTETITIGDKHNDAIWVGDYVKLVPSDSGVVRDRVGMIPGDENPWVAVEGTVSEISVKITAVKPVTTSRTGDPAAYYGGVNPKENENFRVTAEVPNGSYIIASGDKKLTNTSPEERMAIANYLHGGPTFQVEVALPHIDALDYEIKFDLDLYNNMGSFVNSTHFSASTDNDDLRDYITPGGSLILYLEWTAPEDFPLSSEGRKIGTGPYIAKFSTKISSKKTELYNAYVESCENKVEEDGSSSDCSVDSYSDSDTFTKTFGFKRVKNK